MKQLVLIVHPLKDAIEWFERTEITSWKAYYFPERFSEDTLYPFIRYNGCRRVLVLPGRVDQLQLLDIATLSERVELRPDDIVVSDNNPYIQLQNSVYPNFGQTAEDIMQILSLKSRRFLPFYRQNLIFGGYSSGDCVRKLAFEFKRRGFNPHIDPLITELYYRIWPHTDSSKYSKKIKV